MYTKVLFVIPVKHPENAKNWASVKANLEATIKSISNQDSSDWEAVIVANRGADLPQLPDRIGVKWVEFEPNRHYKKNDGNDSVFYEAVRNDKGRRILAGILYARDFTHVMVVDDDDLVSRRISSFIKSNPECNGYYLKDGYIWGTGTRIFFHYDGDFSLLCGTSHIVRKDLLDLPATFEEASPVYIQTMLGSHVKIKRILDERRTPLSPLPFIGAVYRVGHLESHSSANDMLKSYFLQRWLYRHPIKQLKRLLRLRLVDRKTKAEFFGFFK